MKTSIFNLKQLTVKAFSVFVVIIFSTSFINVSAQKKITIGIKGGINITGMQADYFADNDCKTKFNAGIVSEIKISGKFFIQPELLYSRQGAYTKAIMYGGEPLDTEYILDYISLPLMAKLYVSDKIALELGGICNFLANDEEIRTLDNETKTYPANANDFEFSIAAGVSYHFKNRFFGNARSFLGLSNAVSTANNYGLQIGIGYLFK